jgi:hypothetical protein
MREAQELTDTLEENLAVRSLGTTSVRAELVKVFSELVNNSAEHGMPQGGQPGHAFEAVTVDSGAGIRTALARNPAIPQPEPDAHAIGLAVQELVSGTGDPGHRALDDRDGDAEAGPEAVAALGLGVAVHGEETEPEIRETEHRQGKGVRLTVPV